MLKKLLLPPNLVSLYRVLITPVIGYYLSQPDNQSMVIAVLLMFSAGISDALDGYLARKLNQISDFGIAFDPICDKIFAGIIITLMIFYRDFPVWLAVIIVGRDLLIMVAGLILLKGQNIVVPSNLTGKYTFAAIALLLGALTIRFDFGILITTYLSLLLIAASLIVYYRVFLQVKEGKQPPIFNDTPLFEKGRLVFNICFLAVFTYKLWIFLVG